MNALIDTNAIVDVLTWRKPFSRESSLVIYSPAQFLAALKQKLESA